jgi:glycine betaine/proline transport system permease protein
MTIATAPVPVSALPRVRWPLVWLAALAATVLLWLGRDLVPWAVEYPTHWVVPLRFWITGLMKWLVNDATLGLFTFKELTRSVSWLLQQPLDVTRDLLSQGITIPIGEGDAAIVIPPISWFGLLTALVLLAHRIKDRGLAVLVGLCFAYLAVFGQWASAMVTLSSIVIAVPLGIAGGLALGILGYRHRRVEVAMTPVLDLMQTVPVFAYLIPILFLFGFGPVAAMIATIIYAMPPMVRVTILALRLVPTETVEFGNMAGCTRRQMMWKVLVPSAAPGLMVGVNQVIMLSLNMVIIASMIGAGGLGHDVLSSLRKLAIGDGFEAGIGITLLAIAMDRLSQAAARRQPPAHEEGTVRRFVARHPYLLAALAAIVGATALGTVVPALAIYPKSIQVTTGPFWNDLVKWINVNFFDQLEAVKTFLLLNLLIPFKRFLLQLPWVAVVTTIALGGWRLGGPRLALVVGLLASFIAVTGQWEKAMISVYLCGLSVVFACLIGIPIGIWASGNDRVHRVVQVIIDTLQTLPSFVYLIPVVMLFSVGDFSAMIAVVAYALAPAIRYTDHGIRRVPPPLIEAAKVSGCTRWQLLWKVQMRLSLPEIMLGINQTIMMALSMLVITALVGTRDLGQEVYIALTKADTGRGVVAGVCVAFIAIIGDRLIAAWARERKRQLGLD